MNIAVFCSGSGTNFEAIADAVKKGAIKAKIALMVCDNPDAYALTRAKDAGIKTLLIRVKDFPDKQAFEKEIVRNLEKDRIELIVLAGFMRLVSPFLIRKYKNRILNIHPALLPSFKGTEGIKDALDYGVKVTGVTVHFVDEEMDHGPIILQAAIEVRDDDTEESLAKRIHAREHIIYPEAVRLFVEGKLEIKGRKVELT